MYTESSILVYIKIQASVYKCSSGWKKILLYEVGIDLLEI